MRKLSADYIFPVVSKPIKRGVLILESDGTLVDIIDTGGDLREMANLEFYNGILIPGFINCHLHLEFSWVRNFITMHTGLTRFIESMALIRHQKPANAISQAREADQEMANQGIVAAADICSQVEMLKVKHESEIRYINLVETLDSGLNPGDAFDQALQMVNESEQLGMTAYPVPHAPYTVSSKLFRLLMHYHGKKKSIYSIHNQESSDENLWFRRKVNSLQDMFRQHGFIPDPVHLSGKTSLQTIIEYFPFEANILLVHDTFTELEDIEAAMKSVENLFWVLCPNANLYINHTLPPVDFLRSNGCVIAVGTDSYASNTCLSILEELKTLSVFFPLIPLEELIQWATLNGARALNLDNQLGSFEKGKKPGVLLLRNVDLHQMKINSETSINVLN